MSTSSESGNESTDLDTGSDTDTGSYNDNSNSDNEDLGNNGASGGKALQLISLERSTDFEETLQLKLNHNVLDSVLETCGDKPLCVIVITGHARSGKSFMLNCIKESLKGTEADERDNWWRNTKTISGFEWKHGYKRNTEGIWIWSRAFNVVDAEDKEVAVLLLDTQGFNDEGINTAEEVSAILGISLLISSILIVNVTGDIPEECFDWLSPFSKYASLCGSKGLRDPFQKLFFLVRDWTMLFDHQFGGESGKKYLEKVLSANSSQGKRLKNGWEELDCFLMPNIGSNAVLNAFTGNTADLNKEFSSRLRACVNSITSEKSLEHSKKIFGNEIGADELKGFLESYVELWNNKAEVELGLKPESILRTTFEAAGKIKVERGLQAYKEMYRQRKRAACGGYLKNASIDSVHIQGRLKALEAFKQFSLPDEENKQFQRKLEELLDQESKQLKKENEGARTTKISDNVSKACNELRRGLQERFPFTPEQGVNIADNLVFYEENVLGRTLEEMRGVIEAEFLEEFEGEDEEGRSGLERMISSVLQPITEDYMERNEGNRGRAMSCAKEAKDQLREEYLKEMQGLLDQLPNMEANVLGVFHARAVKDIEKKFRELSLGSPTYQAKWLGELKDEIDGEHEMLELSLESTMAKALKMASEEAEKYKRSLEDNAQACVEEEEMVAFHEATSQAILKKFQVDNPFPRESSKGEMIYKKLENLLGAAFTHVVEDGVIKRRRMEEALQNAGLTAFKIYEEDMEVTLNEMEFLEGEHFEMKSASLREKAVNYFEEEIDGITLEAGKVEEAKDELVYKLDEKARSLKNENEQRREMAFGQADSETMSALEQYEAKMMTAASRLSSMEELREEHEKWKEALVQQFHEKCRSKNEGLRITFVTKLVDGVGERFSGVEEFFNMAKQKENVGFMTALLACQTEYVANMNQQFSNRNGFFSKPDLKKLHEKTVKAALRKMPADCILSNKQKKELEEKLDHVLERYVERNDMVFRSFQNDEPAIGIDLGTTYCCVAIYMKGKVQIVRNSVSGDIIPSYVRFNPDGSKVFGTPAKDDAYLSPETTIFDAKRIIGRRMDDEHLQKDIQMWPFTVVEEGGGPKIEVGGNKYFPEEISSFLLEHLKEEAEATLGCKIKKAVITVPAYFTDGQRDATVKAGELAGLEVLGILNEPTAAAVAYRLDCCHDDKERNILVYDLGGGTFDVAVLKLGKDKIDVLAFDGDGHLGGEDFDENMMTYCAEKFLRKTGFDLFQNKDSAVKTEKDDARRRLRRLKTACEERKKALATAPAATISIAAFEGGQDLIVEVTKKKFEEMNQSLFLETIKIVDRALVSADLRKEEIDEIILVGGSTKIPKLQKMLVDHFKGKALNKRINPDQAVAYGAAVQAAIKCAKPDEKIFDFGVIQEVTPMSLGIETANKEFDIIIPKGTKIPTTLKQEYATHRDNQDSAWVRIFQGEHLSRAVDNKLLGDFSLEGIPPNAKGKEVVVVSMHIDANGILSVEAICQSNKGSKKMTVSEENKGIMTNEVKKRLIQERQRP